MTGAVVFDASCAHCHHWWRAVVEESPEEPARRFGLECPECGRLVGRSTCKARRFATVELAAGYAHHLNGHTPGKAS